MSPFSDLCNLNKHNLNRFGTIFPDLDNLQAFKNSQLFKIYAYFGKVKRSVYSKVSISS